MGIPFCHTLIITSSRGIEAATGVEAHLSSTLHDVYLYHLNKILTNMAVSYFRSWYHQHPLQVSLRWSFVSSLHILSHKCGSHLTPRWSTAIIDKRSHKTCLRIWQRPELDVRVHSVQPQPQPRGISARYYAAKLTHNVTWRLKTPSWCGPDHISHDARGDFG